ncbi:hypothetical protein [Leifsonia sp. Leaf264]|uniref:hypothetical protein n=1 Tax=Leifsonia sp. Leaf264 TaxID=1736314 RepID=UPI0012F79C14|nr:hypothetical protein [Leifsonia sp. Leaf264]
MTTPQQNRQWWMIPTRWGLTATALLALGLTVAILSYLDGATGAMQVVAIILTALALLWIAPLTIYTMVRAKRDRTR